VNLRSVDLNLLVALDLLLAERSVSRAAERLHIGQPAMSSTLGRLRALFDDQLLVREGRTLRRTPLAESLVEPLRVALAHVDAVVNVRASFDPAVDERTFSIIASDYVALVLLKPVLAALPTIAPHVQLHVHAVESEALEQLRTTQADLLIIPSGLLPAQRTVMTRHLFDDTFVCVVAKDNPDVGDELTLEQFSSLPYLVLNQGTTPSIVETRVEQLGVTRNVEMIAQSFVMAPFLLPGTRLLATMQRRLAERVLGEEFTLLEPPVDFGSIEEVMVWSPKMLADPGHEWLRGIIADAAAGL
jgi:DNA-binding transcriptional LysR family regulator